MTDLKFISQENIWKLLEYLKKDYRVHAPVRKGEQRFYREYKTPAKDIVIGEVRPFEPLRSFFTAAREFVAEGFKDDIPLSADKPFAIAGVKACDLKSFKIQDHVFLDHDYKDPFYIARREKNFVISADCTRAIETCFCLALGDKPYPGEGFDINLSEVGGGFVVEAGSAKGRAVVEKDPSLFEDAGDERLAERNERRRKVTGEVEANIKKAGLPKCDSRDSACELFKGVIERNYGSGIWADEAERCVECGACTAVCPTCHCFLLYDQKDEKKMARFRLWDSCMIKDYARVAGGANPRSRLWMRLRNRFEKKFDFFPKTADIYACTGCGRCVSACPAKIDIREVLKKLVKK